MTNTKYGKYIVQAHANKEERLGKVAHLFGGKHFGGTNFSPAWVGITAPLFMMREGHIHDYDEYLFFWGTNAEDIDVSVTGDTLTVKAETQEEEEISRDNYLRRERRIGSFCRSVTLPGGLETEKAEADYTDGILTLSFPKAEEVKPKSIEVKAS